jgi:hypothetical protein
VIAKATAPLAACVLARVTRARLAGGDGLRLRRLVLAQVDAQPHHRREGQELAAPDALFGLLPGVGSFDSGEPF